MLLQTRVKQAQVLAGRNENAQALIHLSGGASAFQKCAGFGMRLKVADLALEHDFNDCAHEILKNHSLQRGLRLDTNHLVDVANLSPGIAINILRDYPESIDLKKSRATGRIARLLPPHEKKDERLNKRCNIYSGPAYVGLANLKSIYMPFAIANPGEERYFIFGRFKGSKESIETRLEAESGLAFLATNTFQHFAVRAEKAFAHPR